MNELGFGYPNVTPCMGPATVEDCRRYVDGLTAKEIATDRGVSTETVRSALKSARARLAQRGHDELGNIIGLRRALRAEGLLEGIELL